jgi:hypothetical protein
MAEIKVEDVAQDSVKTETVNENDIVPADPAEDVWDEERLEKAMDTLKEMYIQVRAPSYLDCSPSLIHIQLRALRTAIPRLIAPLTVKQPSRQLSISLHLLVA